MQSLRELFRYGMGPSSSHTMGPRRAAELFRHRHPHAHSFTAALFGTLSQTGRGHLTDRAIREGFASLEVALCWEAESLPFHPNGMVFQALDAHGGLLGDWTVFSIGGGELREQGASAAETPDLYPQRSLAEILAWADANGQPLWALVEDRIRRRDRARAPPRHDLRSHPRTGASALHRAQCFRRHQGAAHPRLARVVLAHALGEALLDFGQERDVQAWLNQCARDA